MTRHSFTLVAGGGDCDATLQILSPSSTLYFHLSESMKLGFCHIHTVKEVEGQRAGGTEVERKRPESSICHLHPECYDGMRRGLTGGQTEVETLNHLS